MTPRAAAARSRRPRPPPPAPARTRGGRRSRGRGSTAQWPCRGALEPMIGLSPSSTIANRGRLVTMPAWGPEFATGAAGGRNAVPGRCRDRIKEQAGAPELLVREPQPEPAAHLLDGHRYGTPGLARCSRCRSASEARSYRVVVTVSIALVATTPPAAATARSRIALLGSRLSGVPPPPLAGIPASRSRPRTLGTGS